MALSEEVRRANLEIARKEAAAAPRLSDEDVARLRCLLRPRAVEAAAQDAARSSRSARSARVGD